MHTKKIIFFGVFSIAAHVLGYFLFSSFFHASVDKPLSFQTAIIPKALGLGLKDHASATADRKNHKIARTKEVAQVAVQQNINAFYPARYLDSSMVDTRPAPIGEWNVDLSVLNSKELRGLTVEYTIWVSEQGVIDFLELLNSDAIPSSVKNALSSLQNTVMAPATIKDVPVPCVMTLELSFGY